jgi:hypothetical protein
MIMVTDLKHGVKGLGAHSRSTKAIHRVRWTVKIFTDNDVHASSHLPRR